MSRIDSDIDLDEVPFLEPDATASTIAADPVSVPNDGTTPITLTVTVRADGGSIIANRAVTIVLTGTGDAVIGPMPGETDENGQVSIDITNETAETLTIGFTLNGDNSPSVVEVEFETAQRYPLDASPTELANIGATAFPERPGNFIYGYSVTGTPENYTAARSGIPLSGSIDISGGKKLIELEILEAQEPGLDVANNGRLTLSVGFIDPFAAVPVSAAVEITVLTNVTETQVRGGTFTENIPNVVVGGTGETVTGDTVAVGLDDDTDEYVFFYNGSELARLTAAPDNTGVFIVGNGTNQGLGVYIGVQQFGQFNDIAAEMKSTYPAGWTDIFGTPVPN